MDIAAVLLDIDGTLVDSNDLHARAWIDAFAEAGFTVPFERLRPLLGMGSDKLLPAIDASLADGSDPGKTIARRRGEIFKTSYLKDVRAFPDVRRLLLQLKQSGVRCVVATSATQDELQAMLGLASIDDLIDDRVTSAEMRESKPAPDIVSRALSISKAEGAQAFMLGDTRFDIEAARRAGVDCIVFRCGGASEAELAGAIAVFDDPTALCDALQTTSITQIVTRARRAKN